MLEGFRLSDKISTAIRQYRHRKERARNQRLATITQSWYETCRQVSETCGKSLFDVNAMPEDVGQVLDQVDRTLFRLRDIAGDAHKAVRYYDRELARRVDLVTQEVFRLRNQTTRFLLRAQGPGILALQPSEARDQKHWHYYRALEEAGFGARDIKTSLDKDIKSLWPELEMLREQAHRTSRMHKKRPN